MHLRLVMVGVASQPLSAGENVKPMPKQPTVQPAQRALVLVTLSTQAQDGATFPQTAHRLNPIHKPLDTASTEEVSKPPSPCPLLHSASQQLPPASVIAATFESTGAGSFHAETCCCCSYPATVRCCCSTKSAVVLLFLFEHLNTVQCLTFGNWPRGEL